MMGRCVQTTQASEIIEPVQLYELREHLRIEHNDDDSYISGLIPASRRAAENYIEGVISDRDYTLFLDEFEREIVLPKRPIQQSSISIEYTDEDYAVQTIENADLLIEWSELEVKIKPLYSESWPNISKGKDKVRIHFTAGFNAAFGFVEPDIKHAIMMIASTLDDQREDHTAKIELKKVPLSSSILLDPYKKYPI